MARPTKYSAQTQREICRALALGASRDTAAQCGGITFETFRQWMLQKPAFSAAVKNAEAQRKVTWLHQIESAAASGNWPAAAWKLERLYPEEYAKPEVRIKHTGDAQAPVEVNVSHEPERTPTVLSILREAGVIVASSGDEPEDDAL